MKHGLNTDKAEQKPSRRATPSGFVTWECKCGHKGGHYFSHYDLCRCDCGAMWWALQPQRDGPLVAYPHPGYLVDGKVVLWS